MAHISRLRNTFKRSEEKKSKTQRKRSEALTPWQR